MITERSLSSNLRTNYRSMGSYLVAADFNFKLAVIWCEDRNRKTVQEVVLTKQ